MMTYEVDLTFVDRSVTLAGPEEYATADSALQWLLALAWDDLQEARRTAADGQWSIACDSQVARIVGLTRLIGPLPWENVAVDLILNGVYERIHQAMGMPTPLTDDEREQVRAASEFPLTTRSTQPT